jgi:hypothetical protein
MLLIAVSAYASADQLPLRHMAACGLRYTLDGWRDRANQSCGLSETALPLLQSPAQQPSALQRQPSGDVLKYTISGVSFTYYSISPRPARPSEACLCS